MLTRDGSSKSIGSYKVKYLGGHPAYSHSKAGAIHLRITSAALELEPTTGTKRWFDGLILPYAQVHSLSIEQRRVGTIQAIAGGLNSRQLNQANNIHIDCTVDGQALLLRLEMLSGFSVMGQAKKCQELNDLLQIHQIRSRFAANLSAEKTVQDIPDQIARLAKLRDAGVLSMAEFEAKKVELLARM